MYFIYLNKLNIIIPRPMYTYSCTVPPNGYYLDLWHFINVIIIINHIDYIGVIVLFVGHEDSECLAWQCPLPECSTHVPSHNAASSCRDCVHSPGTEPNLVAVLLRVSIQACTYTVSHTCRMSYSYIIQHGCRYNFTIRHL